MYTNLSCLDSKLVVVLPVSNEHLKRYVLMP